MARIFQFRQYLPPAPGNTKMSGETHYESYRPGAAFSAAHAGKHLRHGSSRMLETYLGDIEYLAHEQLWNEAVPLALSLPIICTALSHPRLSTSSEAYVQWCKQWVSMMPDQHASWSMRAGCGELDTSNGVPVEALRQLRLRRLSRAAPPRRVLTAEEAALESLDTPEYELCVALLDGTRRWYAEQAAFDSVVQMNLARLAVLR